MSFKCECAPMGAFTVFKKFKRIDIFIKRSALIRISENLNTFLSGADFSNIKLIRFYNTRTKHYLKTLLKIFGVERQIQYI